MDKQLNLYAIVLLFAFIQGIFYASQFVFRGYREKRLSDYFMAALLVALCNTNLFAMLGFMGIYILGQELWLFPHSMGLLVGPLMYYYLKTQINVRYTLQRVDFKHFIPYSLYFFSHLIVFLTGENGINWWNDNVNRPFKISDIENISENLSLVIYLVATLRLYGRYRRWLPTERSDTEGVLLAWYKHFLTVMVIGIFIASGFFVAEFFVSVSYQQDWILRAIVAFIICYLGFSAFHQTQPRQLVFDEKMLILGIIQPVLHPLSNLAEKSDLTPISAQIDAKPLEKSEPKLDPAELEKWRDRVSVLMENEKLYLNPELTLSELSDKMNSHNSLISNVINAGFQKNFNDFVNAYRVAAFQEKVNNPKLSHYTLLALAFECGFNSKSTFNRAVKKATGQLPSTFVRTR
jgi:AraC-like DNA-binding protein